MSLTQVKQSNIDESASQLYGMRNRIINGDMRIDQRNAGAAITGSSVYSVDRFFQINSVAGCTYSVQQDSSAPQGFTKSLKVTVTASGTPSGGGQMSLRQYIEGFNTADLNWGTVNAKTVTLSFWVKSSLTGTFGGALSNNAFDRMYVYEYTINSANTWEYKTVSITGDTTGTWETGNLAGIRVYFGLGAANYTKTAGSWDSSFAIQPTGSVNFCETNGATWQITGVQLEEGSVATPFEHRQYGTELQLCQRYYEVLSNLEGDANRPSATAATAGDIYFNMSYTVDKRIGNPTVTFAGGAIYNNGWGTFTNPVVVGAGYKTAHFTGIASVNQNSSYLVRNLEITVSAEL